MKKLTDTFRHISSSPVGAGGGPIILSWFALIGFLPGMLCADAVSRGTANQTQVAEQKNDLSWPMDKLLEPSFKWQSHADEAKNCLTVSRLDPNVPTATQLLYAVDLPGERFAADPSSLSTSRNYLAWIYQFDGILKKAGYTQQVPVPDSRVLLKAQQEALPHGNSTGYMKQVKNNIRLILITDEKWTDNTSQTASGSAAFKPLRREIFVSNIVSLEQILKEQR